MAMIVLSPQLSIDDADIEISYIRSSGPGGQNVNKVATAVQLRFDLRNCKTLSDVQKERLNAAEKGRINADGILVLDTHVFRSQLKNRAEALEKLRTVLEKSLEEPKMRVMPKAPPGGSAGGGVSQRRAIGKRIRFYDPDEWGE